MKISQNIWNPSSGWTTPLSITCEDPLVFLFGPTEVLKKGDVIASVRQAHPKAILFGCSTAGEIADSKVFDGTAHQTSICFKNTSVKAVYGTVQKAADSFSVGHALANQLPRESLTHLFVLSDGLNVNGTDLVRGLTATLPNTVTVTGGLSGDGSRFEETLVLGPGGIPARNMVSVLGFYGPSLRVGYASLGGWDAYGPERIITRSDGNVLFELDGRSALDLYKEALGEHAKGLPATGLLFPLSLKTDRSNDVPVVRTILAVDEKQKSITFAGTMPQGGITRFMQANFDRLIEGASSAAKVSVRGMSSSPELAILISCVGRKLILKERVVEEVLRVREVLGAQAVMTGFYSYGEISPFVSGAKCELHNQTMTVTTLAEV